LLRTTAPDLAGPPVPPLPPRLARSRASSMAGARREVTRLNGDMDINEVRRLIRREGRGVFLFVRLPLACLLVAATIARMVLHPGQPDRWLGPALLLANALIWVAVFASAVYRRRRVRRLLTPLTPEDRRAVLEPLKGSSFWGRRRSGSSAPTLKRYAADR